MNNNTDSFRLPDFLIIGAGKSGTTSLDNYLKQHPQIFMPRRKEPNFFAYEKVERNSLINNTSLCKHYDASVTNYNKYVSLFNEAEDSQIVGDTSNLYLYHPLAPQSIKHYIPNVKFIAILRHPVDRLYSRYLHLARENRQKGIDFNDIYNQDSIWYKRPDLLPEGFYYKNLSYFMSHFRPEQFHIILYDDFISNQGKVIRDIFSFLEVDPDFIPDTTVNYNKSGFVKNQFINQFVDGKSSLLRTIQTRMPRFYLKIKRNLAIKKAYYSIKASNLERPSLEISIRKEIINNIYKDDILSLQELLKRDLNKWLA